MRSCALPWCFVHPGLFLLLSITGVWVSPCHPTWGTPDVLAAAQQGLQHSAERGGRAERRGSAGSRPGIAAEEPVEEAAAASPGLESPVPQPEGRAGGAARDPSPHPVHQGSALDFHERYRLPKALSARSYFVPQSRSL